MNIQTAHLVAREALTTLYMVSCSFLFSSLIGCGLGSLLFYTAPNSLRPMKSLHNFLGLILSGVTSIPFAILVVVLFPITRWVVGTSLGATASIIPLTIGAVPIVTATVLESLRLASLTCLDPAISLGISDFKIIKDILFPEIAPKLVFSLQTLVAHLISCSTLSGFVGGGGLGQVLLQYGYYRFDLSITLSVLGVTLIFIEACRCVSNFYGRRILKNRGIL
ncbi:binding--dependent transport system inner membrane component family protein [Chlamydia ibidis]|uniref:Binding--dependent transport system inner membrane component family protein n=2 Tax=Chlamydia ibidis TaxID=1405396 RepID=S7J4X2_9CHLA|nr:ABC transporter permease subunit [Chlamydia ibidis]EPP35097.1 binding--dependent transport system inner membrane component family protein [Chlamydia ibidis]EQM62645.1 binding--dependent transport system inner membrane component family protein [Chlamydia ibidis 10-1398/6]